MNIRGGQPETRRRKPEVADHVAEGRARAAEALEATLNEQEFLESLGLESIEALVRDEDAAMMALSFCGIRNAIGEMPKTKRPRYLEQLEKAVVIARATLKKRKMRGKKKS